MPPRDIFLALLVAFVWGVGFVAIKFGVTDMPPLLFSACRFFLAAFPAVFFLKRPATPARLVIAYGLAIGVAQFGLLFISIRLGMPAGLSSLLMQAHVIFTLIFAWIAMGERPRLAQIAGVAIAVAGLGVIAGGRLSGGSALPFALVIAAAASWAIGNIIGKFAGRVDMVAFMAWSSLVAPLPLLALSLIFEGREAIDALQHPTARALLSAAFLGYGATMLGYSLWASLLSRHPAAVVGPFSLLVPVFGFVGARLVFGEQTAALEYFGAALILLGVGWTVFGGYFGDVFARLRARTG